MRNSPSGMFVQCNLLSFEELLTKSIFAFRGRIQSSNNTGRVVMAWDTLIMLTPLRAEGREFDPRPGQYTELPSLPIFREISRFLIK